MERSMLDRGCEADSPGSKGRAWKENVESEAVELEAGPRVWFRHHCSEREKMFIRDRIEGVTPRRMPGGG